MNKFDLDARNFESRMMQGAVVARFKAQAMDILTEIDAGSGFLEFLERVNDETDLHVRHGRDYGYLHDIVTARFRNTIGRYLSMLLIFSKPITAGFQGRISAEYLGLSLAFDGRFAAANTTFTFDNARTGIPASPGITYLMPRYIGPGRTLAFVNQGETIDAKQALAMGLIIGIVNEDRDLAEVCVEYIQTLSINHRDILQSNRQSILPSAKDISTVLDKYYDSMSKVITSRRNRAQP